MRSVVLDTETTGLNAGLGDRIIELGGIEVLSRRVTGNHFHRYINPERESEVGALKVHGITHEFLQDKPKFREIVAEFLDYIQGAELVIHNAAFDVEFLNLELGRLGLPPSARAAPGKEKLPRRLVRALRGRSRSPHSPRRTARRGASRGGLSGHDPRSGQPCDRTRPAAPGPGNADGDSGRAAPANRLSAQCGRARRACAPARRHRGREQGAMRVAPLRDRGGDA